MFTSKNAKGGTIQRKLKVLDVLFVFNRIIKNKRQPFRIDNDKVRSCYSAPTQSTWLIEVQHSQMV